jgi:arylsulfatase A-like enzyme
MSSAKKPNIVFIICDDLGYGDVQCLNPEHGKIQTPHLDAFAKEGMVFTDAHSGSAVCSPTRYGVLTGRYAWRSSLQSGIVGENVPCLISEDRLTWPDFMRQNGYHTACFGKWHLGYRYVDESGAFVDTAVAHDESQDLWAADIPMGTEVVGGPVDRGFDEHLGFQRSQTISTLVRDRHVAEQVRCDEVLQRLGQEACDYLSRRSDKRDEPFFLYLPLNSPHTPISPSPAWQGSSGLGAYGDFVMETDSVVGNVLNKLDDLGLRDDTLVVFTSDNGCSAPAANAEKLESEFGHFPSAHLRGYKSDIWEGGHRVPFFVRWPGHVQPGSVNHQLICLTDMMALCSDIMNVALPEDTAEDSISLRATLLENPLTPVRSSVISHSIAGKFAIRQGEWKLEVCAGSGGWTLADKAAKEMGLPDMQLYNIKADVVERHNLVAQYPEKTAELLALLKQEVNNGRTTPGKAVENDATVIVEKEN